MISIKFNDIYFQIEKYHQDIIYLAFFFKKRIYSFNSDQQGAVFSPESDQKVGFLDSKCIRKK